jgi:syndecan 4
MACSRYTNRGCTTCRAQCAAGTYESFPCTSTANRDRECTACQPGSYKSTVGAAACTACAAGTYSTVSGASLASTCSSCPAGTFSNAGSTACTACQEGIGFSTGVGASACTPCSVCGTAGQYKKGCGGTTGGICESCSNTPLE